MNSINIFPVGRLPTAAPLRLDLPRLVDTRMLVQANSGAARMLQALADVYPRGLTKAALGEAAGISHTSGTFGTYLARLRTLELVNGREEIKASEELF